MGRFVHVRRTIPELRFGRFLCKSVITTNPLLGRDAEIADISDSLSQPQQCQMKSLVSGQLRTLARATAIVINTPKRSGYLWEVVTYRVLRRLIRRAGRGYLASAEIAICEGGQSNP